MIEIDDVTYYTYKEYAQKELLTYDNVKQMVHRGIIWVIKIGKHSYIPDDQSPRYRKRGRPRKDGRIW